MQEEKEFDTKAGLLTGVINARVDRNGMLYSCRFEKRNELMIHKVVYIPKYSEEDFRTRNRDAATFFKSGELKSIYLEKQQEICFPAGRMKAELVTFYESGNLHRVFPAYGQISGFWSEYEEAELLQPSALKVGEQKIKAKISCFCFYESGAIKSITLWPGESVDIVTKFGTISARLGISFYEDGSIESLEPDKPSLITYDSCKFLAYDNHPIGIHGDKNSLCFYENGFIKSLKTTISAVILTGEEKVIRIEPENRVSLIDIETKEIVPLKLEFHSESLSITDSGGVLNNYQLKRYQITTEQLVHNLSTSEACIDCSGCSKCGHKITKRE